MSYEFRSRSSQRDCGIGGWYACFFFFNFLIGRSGMQYDPGDQGAQGVIPSRHIQVFCETQFSLDSDRSAIRC
jgi:hypothetical protein